MQVALIIPDRAPLSAGFDNPRIWGPAGSGWLNGEIAGRPGEGIDW